MSTTAATGFCRVTVVAPDSRIDVALPEDIAVADVYPEILRLTGQTQAAGTPTGYHLVRRDGSVLDGARTLAAQQVLDGEVLSLRPFAQSLPPAVYDDVSDAVASAVTRDRHLWSDELLRGAGLLGGVLLLVLMGFVLWFADPVRHDMHSLPGIIAGGAGFLLTAFAGVRARVYGDRATAVALGLGALPLLLIAGSGIVGPDAGQGPGRLQFLLGCVTVLVASVALVALTPSGDAPFVAATFLAAVGTLATFLAILTETTATETAAVCAPVAIGLVAFLPGLSARFARLPIGYAAPRSAADDEFLGESQHPAGEDSQPVDGERIALQARRATRCSSAWSAAARPSSSAPPPSSASPETSGASSSPSPPASRCCCAPASSATPRRSPASSSPASPPSRCSSSASPSTRRPTSSRTS